MDAPVFYSVLKSLASKDTNYGGGADSTTSGGVSADWKRYSGALAEWSWVRLVNRHDSWGGYRKSPDGSIGTYTDKRPVTKPALVDHFQGVRVRGLHSISLEGTCHWLGLDIDAHGEKTEEQIEANEAYAIERFDVLRAAGFNPLLESNKRGGYHLWLFFSKPITSEAAYRVGLALLATWTGAEKEIPEQFPKRADRHTAAGYGGGWLRIPGRHHKRDEWCKVYNGATWVEGEAACRYILSLNGDDPERLPAEWTTYRSKKEIEAEKRKLEAEAREIERKRQRRLDRQPEITTSDRYAKAEEILDRHDPAVQGAKGSKVAFRLACLLVQGCELSPSEAAAMMLRSSWNAASVPAWSEGELLHKTEDASEKGGPRGYMLRAYDSSHHKWCEPLPIVPALVPDDGETISLEEYRKRMLEDVLERGGKPGVYLLRSVPGAGKTFALRQLVKQSVERALVLLPVHANLAEELANYRAEMPGRSVAATPKRQTPKDGDADDPSANNCWNGLADRADALGLPAVACICNCGCPLRAKCEASGYLHELNEAKKVDVLLATHKRGEVQGLEQLAEGRGLVIIDEDSRQLIKPLEDTRLEDVKRALADLRQALEDPKVLNSAWLNATKDDGDSAKDKKAELDAFLRWSEPVLSDLVTQLIEATATAEITAPKWPIGTVPKKLFPFVFHVLSENRKWPNGSPWPALARVLTTGVAYVADHQRWKKGAADSKVVERWLVSVRRNPLPADASVWIADGTARKDELEALLGRAVEDVTPKGRLPRLMRAVQYGLDITRETSSEKVVSHLRGFLAAHPEVDELGVICHRPHFTVISDLQEPRIKLLTYFGHGSERMSNAWHHSCDALLILGTPRPGPDAVRRELLRREDVAAASIVEPPWKKVIFETNNERGEAEFSESGQYDHPAWRAAFNSLCRTELGQCLGRARCEIPDGIPAYIFSTEPCGVPIAADGLPEGVHSTDSLVLKVLKTEARRVSLFPPNREYLARNNETPQAPIPFRTLHKHVHEALEAGGRPGGLTINGLRSCLQRLEKRGQITRHGNRGYLPVIPSKPEPVKPAEAPPEATFVVLPQNSLDQPEVAYSTTVAENPTPQNALGTTRRHLDDQRHVPQTLAGKGTTCDSIDAGAGGGMPRSAWRK